MCVGVIGAVAHLVLLLAAALTLLGIGTQHMHDDFTVPPSISPPPPPGTDPTLSLCEPLPSFLVGAGSMALIATTLVAALVAMSACAPRMLRKSALYILVLLALLSCVAFVWVSQPHIARSPLLGDAVAWRGARLSLRAHSRASLCRNVTLLCMYVCVCVDVFQFIVGQVWTFRASSSWCPSDALYDASAWCCISIYVVGALQIGLACLRRCPRDVIRE
jgi:hypothetical protein